MNYIKKLQKTVKIYEESINDLHRYINLSKFDYPNNSVNVNDIRLRLNELNMNIVRIEEN